MCQVYARSFFASIPLGRGYSTSPLLTDDGGTEGDEVWLVYATTIKFLSSSNLELHSFMLGCVLRLLTWTKTTSPKATSLIASGECQWRWWGSRISISRSQHTRCRLL